MPITSKYFRIAVEGATTDGRKIERNWISQMAKNFNPTKYGARVWLEHRRGTLPDSPFRAYGDVNAVKAEEVDIDGKKKLALFAKIDPLPDLVDIIRKRQKIYTSIEVKPKFSDSDEAYLMGLSVTDSPASLGTEILTFAAQNPAASPFTALKQSPDNLFTAAMETEIEFEELEAENKYTKGLKDLVARFTTKKKTDDSRFNEVGDTLEKIVDKVIEQGDTFAEKTSLADLQQQHHTLHEAFHALKDALDQEPANQTARPPATGNNSNQTDC